MVMSKRPPLDEWLSLFEATIAAEGITTLAGAAAGNSIIDGGLAGVGANSFVSMLMVVYPGQPRLVDSMDITAFNNGTGEVTFSTAYKGIAAPIPAGAPYKIVTFRFVPAEVAAIEAKLDHATHGLAALQALLDAILLDTSVTLEVKLDTIAGYIDTEIAAILAAVDTEVAAIKAQTDKLAGATPTVGTTTANWNTATGGSGETGEDLVTIGADGVKNKILSLILDISALTNASVVTVKMFMEVNGTERKVYSEGFVRQTQTNGSEPDGLIIIAGPIGIHEALRVEVYSSTSESVAIGYDYMLEVM